MMTRVAVDEQLYDTFASATIDPARWTVLELPTPTGPAWRCEDPGARTTSGEGTLDIHIERFTRHHDRVQIFDDLKHQLVSAVAFEVPTRGSLTFSIEIAATNLGATLYDWRDGQAAFTVLDLRTGWAFRTLTTEHHVFAVPEPLRADSTASPRSLLSCGTSPLGVRSGLSHRHDVRLDVDRRTIVWGLDDGRAVCEVPDRTFPTHVHVALGVTSLQPLADGRSQSVRGQGLSASFGPLTVTRTP